MICILGGIYQPLLVQRAKDKYTDRDRGETFPGRAHPGNQTLTADL